MITSRGNIPVDLASTEHLSPDVMLELIFRCLLVDLPFLLLSWIFFHLCQVAPFFSFLSAPIPLAVSVEAPSLVCFSI
jgi:hypothetical protein